LPDIAWADLTCCPSCEHQYDKNYNDANVQ